MPVDRLRAELAQLREEIAAAEGGDPEALARLQALAGQVDAELAREAALADPAGFVAEVEDAVTSFEASHPNLAAILNNILSVLGSMGV
jgi:hypothetical protein